MPSSTILPNFTKITQRVPVRIALDQSKWTDALRPGLSVVVDVDTRDADGSQHVAASGLVPADVSKTELSERN